MKAHIMFKFFKFFTLETLFMGEFGRYRTCMGLFRAGEI